MIDVKIAFGELTKNTFYAKVNPMLKKCLPIFFLVLLLGTEKPVFAFWMWTPDTNKWVNPKYAVKETPKAQLEFAQGYYKSQNFKKAIEEFNKLINTYPRAREAPEAQYSVGLCYEGMKKPFEAFKAYQKVIDRYPFSDRSPEIVERQYKIGEMLLEGADRKGFMANAAGSETNVIDVFRAVIKNAPYGTYAAPSQYKIGLYLEGKELYQEARDELEKVVNDYPNSEWAKAAQYRIALVDAKRSSASPYDQKTTQSAVDEFKDFVKENPDAQLSGKAQEEIRRLRDKEAHNSFLVANFYEKQKNFKAARIYYSAVVDRYKNTVWATKALEKIQLIDNKIK